MTTTNKLNKLVTSSFPKETLDDWMSEEFQKKLKRVLKNKREKTDQQKDKPHTPYIQFCIEERPELKQQYPKMSAKEITAKLGETWNKLKLDDPKYLERKYNYIPK